MKTKIQHMKTKKKQNKNLESSKRELVPYWLAHQEKRIQMTTDFLSETMKSRMNYFKGKRKELLTQKSSQNYSFRLKGKSRNS